MRLMFRREGNITPPLTEHNLLHRLQQNTLPRILLLNPRSMKALLLYDQRRDLFHLCEACKDIGTSENIFQAGQFIQFAKDILDLSLKLVVEMVFFCIGLEGLIRREETESGKCNDTVVSIGDNLVPFLRSGGCDTGNSDWCNNTLPPIVCSNNFFDDFDDSGG